MMNSLHVVFDGNNTCYRANCTTELYTSTGVRTSALMGTLNITHSVAEQLANTTGKPIKELIYAWDMGHSERRKALFPEYKANRKGSERTEEEKQWMSEFIEQANILYEKLPLFGVKCIRKSKWEGDDIILGLTEEITNKYPDDVVIIVSTDEDFHQLISDKVWIYSPIKQLLFTNENYNELMGIPQELFLTYKLLKGDSSDGIEGIPGIGDKTAKSLVNEYGALGELLSHKDELLKSKRTAKIFTAEGMNILTRNNQLINLKDFVDLSDILADIQELIEEEPFVDTKSARDFLMKYQLVSILTKWKTWSQLFEEIVDNFYE